MNRFFVYGTLRPGESRWSALQDLIIKEPEPAQLINARLYTTGAWPFVVMDKMSASAVDGELITIKEENVPQILRRLDAIEGYYERDDHSLFLRKVQLVYIPSGYPIEDGYLSAYVYVGGTSLVQSAENGTSARIVSGDWKKRFDIA